MFKQGPIPAFVHGVLEYLIAALLIAAPFLFDFASDTATGISIAAGVLVLVVTASAAATPKRVASTRSNAVGVPPRWTWPRIVIRVS